MAKVQSKIFFLAFCIPTLMMLVVQDANALGNFKPSKEELKLLPAYCEPRAYGWGNDKKHPKTRRWYKLFGDQYTRMHHYCHAMLNLRKATLELDPEKSRSLYAQALDDLKYMEKGIDPKFVLLPELYLLFSEAYRGLGDKISALVYAQKAINAKPDYVKGIANFADLAVTMGMREEARKAIETGLKRKPKSRVLKKRLDCLNGENEEVNCPQGYSTRTSR